MDSGCESTKISTKESCCKVLETSMEQIFQKVMKSIEAGKPLWCHKIVKKWIITKWTKMIAKWDRFWLLQSGTTSITKWDELYYYKVRRFYYKVWRVLQSEITLWQSGTDIKNWGKYYKVVLNTAANICSEISVWNKNSFGLQK